jgi:RNA polymerase primary sigma factor
MSDCESLSQFMKDANRFPLLSKEEEIALAAKIQNNDKAALELLVNSNLRLAIKISYDFAGRGLSIEDLISEACIGLFAAAQRFDPTKFDSRFATYCIYWLKQRLRRALCDQSRTIRVPVAACEKITQIRAAGARMSEQLGREATDIELSEELGVPEHRVSDFRIADMNPASLDAPVADLIGAHTFGETVQDAQAENPAESLMDANLKSTMLSCMDVLTDRERVVITYRFGLSGGKPQTLGQIGDRQGVQLTRERVRQICIIALAKLKRALEKSESGIVPLHFNGNGNSNGNGAGH